MLGGHRCVGVTCVDDLCGLCGCDLAFQCACGELFVAVLSCHAVELDVVGFGSWGVGNGKGVWMVCGVQLFFLFFPAILLGEQKVGHRKCAMVVFGFFGTVSRRLGV